MKETLPKRSGIPTSLALKYWNIYKEKHLKYIEQQIHCNYQLFFMKKLWINNTPGKDRNADQIFHFPQEVPKYLNGYYRIPKTDAIKLAALLYRVQCDSDSSVLRNQQQFQSILPQLLPEDTIKLTKAEDWRKSIVSMYNSQIGLKIVEYAYMWWWLRVYFLFLKAELDTTDAKIEFLKLMQEYPTFGSTFFVVKQTTDKDYPEVILIAINRHGFHVIDPDKKVYPPPHVKLFNRC